MSFGFLISGLCDSQVRVWSFQSIIFQSLAGSCNAALNWVFLSQSAAQWNSLALGGDAPSFAIYCKVPSEHPCMSGGARF